MCAAFPEAYTDDIHEHAHRKKWLVCTCTFYNVTQCTACEYLKVSKHNQVTLYCMN